MNTDNTQLTSTSDNPDLDWSQVRETVRIIQATAIHIELAMSGGDDSITTLVESFSMISSHADKIENTFEALKENIENPERANDLDMDAVNQTSAYLSEMKSRSSIAVEAFQFYDRLWQKLTALIHGLEGTSNLIADPSRLYNPIAWKELQTKLRDSMNMEEDRAMFDAIMAGKSRAEAVEIAAKEKNSNQQAKDEDEDIEFF